MSSVLLGKVVYDCKQIKCARERHGREKADRVICPTGISKGSIVYFSGPDVRQVFIELHYAFDNMDVSETKQPVDLPNRHGYRTVDVSSSGSECSFIHTELLNR